MSAVSQNQSIRQGGSPGLAGALFLLVTALLLLTSWQWLRVDRRFVGAATLTAAVRTVLTYGVAESTADEICQAGAVGLTSVLDPFSGFMPPVEYDRFTEETEGEYVGIGVEIKLAGEAIVIVHVFPQSAAADAMLRPGDRIVAIDGVPTAGVSLSMAIQKMRGPVDSAVTIDVVSPGGRARTVTLPRRSVSVTPLPICGVSLSGVAYVRWSAFSLGSADRLAAVVEDLSVQAPIGLVIDLRGNPGGVLDEAVNAAGIFLPPGTVVCRLSSRWARDRFDYVTGPSPSTYSGPLILLLDETSASASEVFAAALQETGRAVIVGRRSFGKGWVQTVFRYGEEGALRLSTGRYVTPNGRTFGDPRQAAVLMNGLGESMLSGGGLEPDIVIPRVEVGVWERTLWRQGIFADLAMESEDEWFASGPDDADMLLEVLHNWCDSLGIEPDALGGSLLDDWQRQADRGIGLVEPDTIRSVARVLAAARREDASLLFDRERKQLLLRLWEQRIETLGRPDEGELEALFDVDPALSIARDILEEPERYRTIAARHQVHAVGTRSGEGDD